MEAVLNFIPRTMNFPNFVFGYQKYSLILVFTSEYIFNIFFKLFFYV